jgi:antitoxin PrlF
MKATLSSKNQVTIPKEVREFLGIKPGDQFKFFIHPDGIVGILPMVPVTKLKGSLPKLDHTLTVEEMNRAIRSEYARR